MRRLLIALVALTVCVLAILGIAKALSFAKQVIGIPREAYASDWTAVFIIEHIRTTGNANWMGRFYATNTIVLPFLNTTRGHSKNFKSLINVDWDVSIADI